jgi:broad specificity phosphatase PhoE
MSRHWYHRGMRIPAKLHRRPFLAPIGLVALAALAWVAAALVLVGLAWFFATARATTVVVVRHAEKVMDGSPDPALTDEGQARAALLGRLFGDRSPKEHIDAIYVSPALRNRLTAAPLAAQLGLAPETASEDDPRGFARRVLHEHRGDRILVVGDADTLPALVEALSGAKDIPPIGAADYGTMYVIGVPRVGRANVLRVAY